jgi:RHS repeat-associated protein
MGAEINNRFTGQELDEETDLHYYGARYYAAAIAKFTQADPLQNYLTESKSKLFENTGKKLEEILSQPQALNTYSYALNNPVILTDPNGECVWDACLGEGSVITSIIAVSGGFLIVVYNDKGEQISQVFVNSVEGLKDFVDNVGDKINKTLDKAKDIGKKILDKVKDILKGKSKNPSEVNPEIENAPKEFPKNPDDFNPKGWENKTFKDPKTGREIKKWRTPDGSGEYEWNEGGPNNQPPHWHKNVPPGGQSNRVPHPDTGDTHIQPGQRFF